MLKFELIKGYDDRVWAVPVKKKLFGLIKKIDWQNAKKIDMYGWTQSGLSK